MDPSVRIWFVETLKKLPRVGRKTLDVSALSFGVKGIESERRLSAAADPADDGQLADREVDIQTLQIVLCRTSEFDCPFWGRCFGR